MNITTFYGLGRRKSSVARVFLTPGTGKFAIITKKDKKSITKTPEEYFSNNFFQFYLERPLKIIEKTSNFDVNAYVNGGGYSGQLGAISLALTRALISYDASLKPKLKSFNLTTCDSRVKERKKIGKHGARRSPQFTKR